MYEPYWENDIDVENNKIIKMGICPDCGEKINSKKCCCYSGE